MTEDQRRELAGQICEETKDIKELVMRLVVECHYSFEEAYQLASSIRADMEDYYNER